MKQIIRKIEKLQKKTPRTSEVLVDYEYWLKRKYAVTGAYLVNAKSFLKTYAQGGNVQSQLTDYINQKGTSLRSILNRFLTFLELREFVYLVNDLTEPKLPRSNPYVKIFLATSQDRLRSSGSMSIYATILNGYFELMKDDVTRINKRTAAKYILSPELSDYTKRLYKSVLKAFCQWVLEYQTLDSSELSPEQRFIKRELKKNQCAVIEGSVRHSRDSPSEFNDNLSQRQLNKPAEKKAFVTRKKTTRTGYPFLDGLERIAIYGGTQAFCVGCEACAG